VAQAALRILALEPRWAALGAVTAELFTPPLRKAIDGARQADDATLRVVKALCVVDALAARPVELDDAEKWLRLRREIEEYERDFRERAEADSTDFGPVWNGRATEWDRLAAGLAWCGMVKKVLGDTVLPECALRLATMPVGEPVLGSSLGKWAGSNRDISAQFKEQRSGEVSQQLRGHFDEADALLKDLTRTIDDVGEWHAHMRVILGLAEQGLGEVTNFCLNKRVAAEHVREILERALCEAWVDDVLKRDSRLADFRADDRDALAEDFRRLD